MIPFDPEKDVVTSGIRVGVTAIIYCIIVTVTAGPTSIVYVAYQIYKMDTSKSTEKQNTVIYPS